jgi:hypothetical protein
MREGEPLEIDGKNEYVARWIHGLCAIPVLVFLLIDVWLMIHGSLFEPWGPWKLSAGGFGVYLLFRLLQYAFTGEGNINPETLDS